MSEREREREKKTTPCISSNHLCSYNFLYVRLSLWENVEFKWHSTAIWPFCMHSKKLELIEYYLYCKNFASQTDWKTNKQIVRFLLALKSSTFLFLLMNFSRHIFQNKKILRKLYWDCHEKSPSITYAFTFNFACDLNF